MQPKFFTETKVKRAIVHSAGEFDQRREFSPSLVIRRQNPIISGSETLLPARLLYGLIPSSLLETHRFWQGEDSVLRGTPRDARDEWFDYQIEVRACIQSRRSEQLQQVVLSKHQTAGWVGTITRKGEAALHQIDSANSFRTGLSPSADQAAADMHTASLVQKGFPQSAARYGASSALLPSLIWVVLQRWLHSGVRMVLKTSSSLCLGYRISRTLRSSTRL